MDLQGFLDDDGNLCTSDVDGKIVKQDSPVMQTQEFDPDKASALCDLLSEGKTLKYSLTHLKLKRTTFNRWLSLNDDFKSSFEEAKRYAMEFLLDESLEKDIKASYEEGVSKDEVQIAKMRQEMTSKHVKLVDPGRYAQSGEEAIGGRYEFSIVLPEGGDKLIERALSAATPQMLPEGGLGLPDVPTKAKKVEKVEE